MKTTNCPRHDVLVAYQTGELTETSAETVTSHVSSCPTCQAELNTIRDTEDTFLSRVRASLAEQEPFLAEPGCTAAVARVQAAVGSLVAASPSAAVVDSVPHDLGQLGEYELLQKLGEGGMGAVYKARHMKLDRLVALKVLPKERMQNPSAVSRFEREMKAVGRLNHPHIVQAHDAREIDGTHFLAMEYVEGLDLAKLVSQTGPLRVADACELVRQAAVGLQHAHEQGLVHRDIKPSNLMLTWTERPHVGESHVGESLRDSHPVSERPDHVGESLRDSRPVSERPGYVGETVRDSKRVSERRDYVAPLRTGIVKILDLGLALLGADQPDRPEMTAAGTAMGTADYVSPEQVTDSHSVDIRSDIYSLGCTLYKLLSGRAPFVGPEFKNDVTKMMAHVNKTPAPISLLRTDLPPGLAAVIERMMAKRPEDRFATPAEVVTALAPFAVGCDLGRLLDEARGTLSPPAVETPPTASTGKLSGSAHLDTATSTPLATVLPGEAPAVKGDSRADRESVGVAYGGGRRRTWIALATAAAAIPLLFGVWVIVRDRSGKEVGRMQVPEGGSASLVDDQGRPVQDGTLRSEPPKTQPGKKPAAEPSSGKVAERPKPITIALTHEPLDLPAGAPISKMAIVPQPAAIPGLQSWTIETIGHRGDVRVVAYSPDGKLLATASHDGTVRLWDADTEQFIRVIAAHDGAIGGLCWSPDGSVIATASWDGTVRVWNPLTGRRMLTLRTKESLSPIAWSPDGRYLVAGSRSRGAICAWQFRGNTTESGAGRARPQGWTPVAAGVLARVFDLPGGTPSILSLVWAPDGTTLAYANNYPGGTTHVQTLNLSSGRVVPFRNSKSDRGLCADGVAWSPDGKKLAIGSYQGVTVFDADTERELARLPAFDRKSSFVVPVWLPDSRRLAAGSNNWFGDRLCELFDPSNAASVVAIQKEEGTGSLGVKAIACRPDGERIAVARGYPKVQVFHADSGAVSSDLPGHYGTFQYAYWGQHANALVCVGAGLKKGIVVGPLGTIVHELPMRFLLLQSDSIATTGTTLGILSYTGNMRLQLWDIASGRSIRDCHFGEGVSHACWAPDGRFVAISQSSKEAELWDAETGRMLHKLPGKGDAFRFSPDGRQLAVASSAEIIVCDPQTGESQQPLTIPCGGLGPMAWSPDGRQIAVAGEDKSVYVVELQARGVVAACKGHTEKPYLLKWLDDGATLVSGSRGELCVWEPATGRLQRTLAITPNDVSPDGQLIATCESSLVRLYRMSDGNLQNTLLTLQDKQSAAVSRDGHFRGSPDVEQEFVYVALTDDGEQITLTPAAFAEKYGWKNDPAKVTLTAEASQQGPNR